MAMEHEYWLERSGIYALGELEGDELKEFQIWTCRAVLDVSQSPTDQVVAEGTLLRSGS
jgi:hypothetical protein